MKIDAATQPKIETSVFEGIDFEAIKSTGKKHVEVQ